MIAKRPTPSWELRIGREAKSDPAWAPTELAVQGKRLALHKGLRKECSDSWCCDKRCGRKGAVCDAHVGGCWGHVVHQGLQVPLRQVPGRETLSCRQQSLPRAAVRAASNELMNSRSLQAAWAAGAGGGRSKARATPDAAAGGGTSYLPVGCSFWKSKQRVDQCSLYQLWDHIFSPYFKKSEHWSNPCIFVWRIW